MGRRFRHRLFGPAAHAYRGFRNADPACRRLDTDRCFHQPQLHQQGQRGGQRGGRQEREGRRDPQAQSRAARTCGRGGRGCGGCSRTGSETRPEGGRTAARAAESGGTRGAKTRPDPCGTSVGVRCGPEVRAGRGRKSLPRTDARRETRRRGDCRGADAPSRGGRGVHRGGPFASRGPCGDRPQRAGRAGTPCGARRRGCGARPGGGSGERACTVRFRCALYRDHRAGRRARRGAGGRRGDGRGQRGETSRREGDPHGELRPAEGPGELPQAARDAPGGLHFRFGGLGRGDFREQDQDRGDAQIFRHSHPAHQGHGGSHGDALRDRAGAGNQDLEGAGPRKRYCAEPQGAGYSHHRADSGQGNHRHRGSQPRQAGGFDVFGRAFAAFPGVEGRASGGDRAHDPERKLRLRPGQDAAPAGRRSHGTGQVRGAERHHHLAPVPQTPRAAEVRDDRPQDGRILALRQDRTAFPRQDGIGGRCDHHRSPQGGLCAQLALYGDGQPSGTL